ncbi:MAG: RnfABCDGE type electron transport complex subunit D [Oscillospiraceae bacterium]|nr:RnfABCDGE type electron transport complex subunit D [Oscillospiraceae bacterium]
MLNQFSQKTENKSVLDMLLVSLALVFMSYYYYGLRAIILTLISILSAYVTDMICVKIRGEKYDFTDFSVPLSGILMALMMPASVSYHIVILSNILAITLGKQFFGGKGKNIFNPTVVGFILSSICWGNKVLLYPKPEESLPLTSELSVSLSPSLTRVLGYASNPSVSNVDIFIGKFTGPMGATHIVIILVCAIVLICRRSASFLTFFGGTGTIAVLAYFFKFFGSDTFTAVFYQLASGTVLFSMLFFACDYYVIPKSKSSRLLYGIIIGGLTILIQVIGKVENAVLYALIIAAPIGIMLDESAFSFGREFKKIKKKLFSKNKKVSAGEEVKNEQR